MRQLFAVTDLYAKNYWQASQRRSLDFEAGTSGAAVWLIELALLAAAFQSLHKAGESRLHCVLSQYHQEGTSL